MPYIPLNRIQTDLFTNGGEYVYRISGVEYTGDYYKLYNGQTFSGASPDEPFSQEIVPLLGTAFIEDEYDLEGRTVSVPLGTEDPDIVVPYKETLYNINLLNEYIKLQGLRPDQVPKVKKILAQNIVPTEKDYELGQFFRFFVKKRNEPVYIEIDRKLFELVKKQDVKLYSKYYLPFRLLWTLTGNEDDVFEANKSIADKAERALDLIFLPEFLELDWLKYYRKS